MNGRVCGYVYESNGIALGLDAEFIAIRVIWEDSGIKENRKTFSHREHGFPTGGGAEEW
jgi:hypothetical protein